MSNNNELTGEPALYLALFSGALQMAAAFWLPWPDETVAIINAAAVALVGAWIAWQTRSVDNGGSVKAAILGAGQALITLAMVFGWHATDKQTASIILVLGLAVGVFVRQTSKPKNAPVVATPVVHVENYHEARP